MALTLKAPAPFTNAQSILVSSLRISIADDQALADWATARASGSSSQRNSAAAILSAATAAVVVCLAFAAEERRNTLDRCAG
jgi:hypothetical protein